MQVRALVFAGALALAAVPGAPAWAQDAREEEPAAPDAEAAQQEALERFAALYERVARRPARPDLSAQDLVKVRARAAREQGDWRKAVGDLVAAAEAHLEGDAVQADPRALFYRGTGRLEKAGFSAAEEARTLREGAASDLHAFLARAPADDVRHAPARLALGQALLYLGRAEDAARELEQAVPQLLADNRRDEAGQAAFQLLNLLVHQGLEARAQGFADAVHAEEADFGASTEAVRRLVARSRVAVGAPLPALPEVVDTDGRPVVWSELRGKPFVLHFFQAGYPTGMPSSARDVETALRPLWDELHEAGGLEMVGISMDEELPESRAAEIRRQWEEWGKTGVVHTGARPVVADWCEEQGLAWRWVWDGKSTDDPVSQALGGVGVSQPFAVLVDPEGVVRWRGAPPYEGLAEAARKAVRRR